MDAYEGVLVVRPRAFGCRFEVRSGLHRGVLEREVREAEEAFGGVSLLLNV